MQVLVVVSQGQHIPFLAQIAPIKIHVHIGELVRDIRHTLPIGQVLHLVARAADLELLIVADIHLGEITADAQPMAETITDREIATDRPHLAVVRISRSLLTATQILHVALDVIFRVTVDETALHIDGMLAERAAVAQVQVDIVTVLRPDRRRTAFQVLIAEHLLDSRQPIGLLVREFRLKLLHYIIGTGGAIAP